MLDAVKAQRLLEQTANMLEDANIGYFIDSGTLLGAIRDNAVNIYDHDLDIRILPGQWPDDDEHEYEMIGMLRGVGYRPILPNYGKRGELICLNNEGIMLDLKFAYQDEQHLWMYCWRQPFSGQKPKVHCYPRKFFRHMKDIEFLGRKYPAPSPVLEYIEHHYGPKWQEFKTRIEQADESDLSWDYMNDPPCAMTIEELMELRKNGA